MTIPSTPSLLKWARVLDSCRHTNWYNYFKSSPTFIKHFKLNVSHLFTIIFSSLLSIRGSSNHKLAVILNNFYIPDITWSKLIVMLLILSPKCNPSPHYFCHHPSPRYSFFFPRFPQLPPNWCPYFNSYQWRNS